MDRIENTLLELYLYSDVIADGAVFIMGFSGNMFFLHETRLQDSPFLSRFWIYPDDIHEVVIL